MPRRILLQRCSLFLFVFKILCCSEPIGRSGMLKRNVDFRSSTSIRSGSAPDLRPLMSVTSRVTSPRQTPGRFIASVDRIIWAVNETRYFWKSFHEKILSLRGSKVFDFYRQGAESNCRRGQTTGQEKKSKTLLFTRIRSYIFLTLLRGYIWTVSKDESPGLILCGADNSAVIRRWALEETMLALPHYSLLFEAAVLLAFSDSSASTSTSFTDPR